MPKYRTRFGALCAAVTLSVGLAAAPANAQTTQEGLVNVAIEDVIVQVPVAVAANICDVNVAVLAEVADDAAACEATADSTATAGPSSNAPTRQDGLVNVLLDDIVVQVPITVAANVCDVNVAVLARVLDDAEACTADPVAAASPGPGAGGGSRSTAEFVPVAGLTELDNDIATDDGAANLVTAGDTVFDAAGNILGGLTALS